MSVNARLEDVYSYPLPKGPTLALAILDIN